MNTELLFPFPLNLSGRFQVERSAPKLNRWENSDNEYTFKTSVPGLTEEDIILEVHNKKLLLKIDGSNGFGVISRQQNWTLPSDADIDNIQASLSRGVLTVTIARVPESQAQRIGIKNLDSKDGSASNQEDSSQ